MVEPIKQGKSGLTGCWRPDAVRQGRGAYAKCRGDQRERRRGQEHDGDQPRRGSGRSRPARVLLIDADPSGNATLGFFPRGTPPVGLADALLEGQQLEDVAVTTAYEGLHVVTPGDRLSTCSDQMGSAQGLGQGREFRIRRLFKGLTGYDVAIVDTSPVLTPLNVAILYAVTGILIPIDPCVAALAGVRTLEELVRSVSEFRLEFTDAGPLTINGVLVTRADRTLVSKQIEAEVRNYFGSLVYPRAVPVSVKFREAYARVSR